MFDWIDVNVENRHVYCAFDQGSITTIKLIFNHSTRRQLSKAKFKPIFNVFFSALKYFFSYLFKINFVVFVVVVSNLPLF